MACAGCQRRKAAITRIARRVLDRVAAARAAIAREVAARRRPAA